MVFIPKALIISQGRNTLMSAEFSASENDLICSSIHIFARYFLAGESLLSGAYFIFKLKALYPRSSSFLAASGFFDMVLSMCCPNFVIMSAIEASPSKFLLIYMAGSFKGPANITGKYIIYPLVCQSQLSIVSVKYKSL